MTKVLVAAIAALFTVVSVPASAQLWYPCPPCPKGQNCPICKPPSPPGPPHPPGPPGRVFEQQPVYPQFVNPPFVGLCVTDVGTCQVFRAPGSYCECKNWIGEVFSGQVQ